MCFFVIPSKKVYNGIFERPILGKLDAVVSLVHLKFKFHDEFGRPAVVETDHIGAHWLLEVSRKRSMTTSVIYGKTSKKVNR